MQANGEKVVCGSRTGTVVAEQTAVVESSKPDSVSYQVPVQLLIVFANLNYK
jgi:hypothetical protein